MMDKEAKENCVFCKILDGKIPASMIFEDKKIAVFIFTYMYIQDL